jgi:hypothetical protein
MAPSTSPASTRSSTSSVQRPPPATASIAAGVGFGSLFDVDRWETVR